MMLADAVEAAVRSMPKPTPGRVEGLVRKIIKERLADGQLDESNVTLRDLDLIADAFVKVLTGMFHHRVEYPDGALNLKEKPGEQRLGQTADEEGLKASGSADGEQTT